MLYMIQWTDMQSNPLSSQLCMKLQISSVPAPKVTGAAKHMQASHTHPWPNGWRADST